jgi:hypothetical protein
MNEDSLKSEFTQILKACEYRFSELQLYPVRTGDKGLTLFSIYENTNMRVEFFFGPDDWSVDVIVETKTTRYDLSTLLEIRTLEEWTNTHPFPRQVDRNLKNELLWFLDLIEQAMPLLA